MRPAKPFNQDVRKNKAVIGSSARSGSARTKYRDEDSFSRSAGLAYHKAQVRGLHPKHRLNDWYAVEEEN